MPAIAIPLVVAAVGAGAKLVAANQQRQQVGGATTTANRLAGEDAKAGDTFRAGLLDPSTPQGSIFAQFAGPQERTTEGTYSQFQDTSGVSGKTLSPEFAGLPAQVKERAATAGPMAGMLEKVNRNAALTGQSEQNDIMNTAAATGMNPDVLRAAAGAGAAGAERQAGRQAATQIGDVRRTAANADVMNMAQMLLQQQFSDTSRTRGQRGSTDTGPGNYGAALGMTAPRGQQIFAGGQRVG